MVHPPAVDWRPDDEVLWQGEYLAGSGPAANGLRAVLVLAEPNDPDRLAWDVAVGTEQTSWVLYRGRVDGRDVPRPGGPLDPGMFGVTRQDGDGSNALVATTPCGPAVGPLGGTPDEPRIVLASGWDCPDEPGSDSEAFVRAFERVDRVVREQHERLVLRGPDVWLDFRSPAAVSR